MPVKSGEATLVSASGKVSVKAAGSSSFREIQPPAVLLAGDTIETGANSYAVLFLTDKSTVKLAQKSRISLSRLDANESDKSVFSKIQLELGKIWVNVQKFLNKDSSFEVESGSAVAAVHGTAFEMENSENEAIMKVWDGTVHFRSRAENVAANPGAHFRFFHKERRLQKGIFDRAKKDKWQRWNHGMDRKIHDFRGKMPGFVRSKHKDLQFLHKKLRSFPHPDKLPNYIRKHQVPYRNIKLPRQGHFPGKPGTFYKKHK